MSNQQTCSTCQHFRDGLCCRFPPVIWPPAPPEPGFRTPAFVFPEVNPTDVCGEWSWVGHNMTPKIERRDG